MKIIYKFLLWLLLFLLHSFTAAAPAPSARVRGTSICVGVLQSISLQRVSYFHNTPQQTDDTPNITASGYRLSDSSKVIAVSRDLLKKYPYGTEVFLKIGGKLERYTVQDTMNKRFRNSIDVFVPNGGRVSPEKKLYLYGEKWVELLL